MTEVAVRYVVTEWRRPAESSGAVRCVCGHVVFDGQVIRSRCVDIVDAVALCRCKRGVRVPVRQT